MDLGVVDALRHRVLDLLEEPRHPPLDLHGTRSERSREVTRGHAKAKVTGGKARKCWEDHPDHKSKKSNKKQVKVQKNFLLSPRKPEFYNPPLHLGQK